MNLDGSSSAELRDGEAESENDCGELHGFWVQIKGRVEVGL
jgi:hypothetical protein